MRRMAHIASRAVCAGALRGAARDKMP